MKPSLFLELTTPVLAKKGEEGLRIFISSLLLDSRPPRAICRETLKKWGLEGWQHLTSIKEWGGAAEIKKVTSPPPLSIFFQFQAKVYFYLRKHFSFSKTSIENKYSAHRYDFETELFSQLCLPKKE